MNTKNKYSNSLKALIAVLFFVILPSSLFNSDIEYEVKAGFFKHFSKSFTWPESAKSKSFTIGILGNSKIYDIGKRIYKNSKLKNKKVVFERYDDVKECEDCHILFVSESYEGDLEPVIKLCRSKSILSMSETEGYGQQGIMINFFITSKGTTAFEINPRSIIKAKLEFDLNILNLGTIVGE